MAVLKGNAYQKSPLDLPSQHEERLSFLKKIGIEIPEKHLTKKEILVIKHLVQGLSASKIAQALVISPRTVEHHLERIKDKLDCDSKSELIQKVQEIDFLSCLDSSSTILFP